MTTAAPHLRLDRLDDPDRRSRRVLEPAERTAEILFGLIMVLTFTGSLSIAETGRSDIRAMLVAAIGCNMVWGIIDGALYVMCTLAEKSRNLAVYRSIRGATDIAHARRLIATVSPILASVLRPTELKWIRDRLTELPPPERARLNAADWTGGLEVCLLVFFSIAPVVVPFLVIADPATALRTSHVVAVMMLFAVGVAYGRSIHRHPWIVGLSMVLLGVALVALTITLGG